MDKLVKDCRERGLGRYLGLLAFGLGVLFILVFMFSSVVAADDVEVDASADSYVRENTPNSNFGSATGFAIDNNQSDSWRGVLRFVDSDGGGNVTSVMLWLYYWYCNGPDASIYEQVYVRRLTGAFVESEVTWNKKDSGNSWTTPGGDFTDYQGVMFEDWPEGSGGEWVSVNITGMAMTAWSTGDLYVLVKFRYELCDFEEYPEEWRHFVFASSEHTNPDLRPYLVVSYVDEEQAPEVGVEVDEIGHTWVDTNVSPVLYDAEWVVVSAEVALDGTGNYSLSSSSYNVSVGDPIECVIEGLEQETEYDLRGKVVWSGGTVYSDVEDVETRSYIVPSFGRDVSDIGLYEAVVYGSWSGNSDEETVNVRVKYKRQDWGTWSYTSWKGSGAVNGSESWSLELSSLLDYDYAAQFDIQGDYYETSVGSFKTGSPLDLDCAVNDKGLNFVELKVDYDCGNSTWGEVYCRLKRDGTYDWVDSGSENVSGVGSAYIEFHDLLGGTKYYYYAVGIDDELGETDTSHSAYFWTEDIDIEPSIDDMWASFISPDVMRLYAYITVGDAIEYTRGLYFKLGPGICGLQMEQTGWDITTGTVVVGNSGEYYVDLICGDALEWDATYSYYGVFDYTVGSVVCEEECFDVNPEPFGVVTLEPASVGADSAVLRGRVQMGGVASEVRFRWWVSGTNAYQYTQWVEVTGSGVYEWELTGLSYGASYSYQFGASYGELYGEVVTFRCGYWQDPGDGGGVPEIPGVTDFWSTIFPGGFPLTAVKALFGLVVVIAAGGIVIWKVRGHGGVMVGMVVMCGLVLIFGMVRWFPLWVILMLAVVLALGFLIAIKRGGAED